MSVLMDLVQSNLRDSSLDAISRQLGQDRLTTSNAIDSALPILIGALKQSSAADNGEGLKRALDAKHDGSILDDITRHIGENDRSDGRGILRHILGPNRDSVSMFLGAQTGIGEERASVLMATLAPVVLGALGKARSRRYLDGGELTELLSDETNSLAKRTPSMMKVVSQLVDQDGDGDADLNDVMSAMPGKI